MYRISRLDDTPLSNGAGLGRVAGLVDHVGCALRTIIALKPVRRKIKETNRDVVKTQVIRVKTRFSAGSTVENGAVVRISVTKAVLGHVGVNILSSLIVLLAVNTVLIKSGNVEAVELAVLEVHPLTTGSITAVFLASDALVSDEAQVGGLHDVVGDLGLDVSRDGLDEVLDRLGSVAEEEPAAVEELGDGRVDPGAVLLGGGEAVESIRCLTLLEHGAQGSRDGALVNLLWLCRVGDNVEDTAHDVEASRHGLSLLHSAGDQTTNGASQANSRREPLQDIFSLVLSSLEVCDHLANLKVGDDSLLNQFIVEHLELAVHALDSLEDPVRGSANRILQGISTRAVLVKVFLATFGALRQAISTGNKTAARHAKVSTAVVNCMLQVEEPVGLMFYDC
ncbi:hypothetical protein HG531_005750 [Fusarium graminearum]|nr:hypothetical protein HG531_005750 [Fusarium graminearum]